MWRVILALAVVYVAWTTWTTWTTWTATAHKRTGAVHLDEAHLASARDAMDAFEELYTKTFLYPEPNDDGHRYTLVRMARASDAVQGALFDAIQRSPNDMDVEDALRAMADSAKTDHVRKMNDVRDRIGSKLLYPKPIDDDHYRRWWVPATEDDVSAIRSSRYSSRY